MKWNQRKNLSMSENSWKPVKVWWSWIKSKSFPPFWTKKGTNMTWWQLMLIDVAAECWAMRPEVVNLVVFRDGRQLKLPVCYHTHTSQFHMPFFFLRTALYCNGSPTTSDFVCFFLMVCFLRLPFKIWALIIGQLLLQIFWVTLPSFNIRVMFVSLLWANSKVLSFVHVSHLLLLFSLCPLATVLICLCFVVLFLLLVI